MAKPPTSDPANEARALERKPAGKMEDDRGECAVEQPVEELEEEDTGELAVPVPQAMLSEGLEGGEEGGNHPRHRDDDPGTTHKPNLRPVGRGRGRLLDGSGPDL